MMLMRNFLQSRKSVREFKARDLSQASVKGIQDLIDQVAPKAAPYNARYTFVEDGKELYQLLEGKGGYAGVMIKAPSYVILNVENSNSLSYINGAYYMEELISGLLNLGIGSCWISLLNVGMEDRVDLSRWGAEDADFMLALGYPNNSAIIGEQPYSSRLGIEDIVYQNEIGTPISLETLEQRGLDDLFYYVRFAPSQYNEQPWRYVVKYGSIDMYMIDTGRNFLVEAGIAMYYFENLLHTLSIPTRFQSEGLQDQGDHKYIGSIQI